MLQEDGWGNKGKKSTVNDNNTRNGKNLNGGNFSVLGRFDSKFLKRESFSVTDTILLLKI